MRKDLRIDYFNYLGSSRSVDWLAAPHYEYASMVVETRAIFTLAFDRALSSHQSVVS